jgi:hypothetical protein
MYYLTDGEVKEMLDQVYCSQQSMASPKGLHLFATADPPPIWRSEMELMRDMPRSAVKEETMLCTDSQEREDDENVDMWDLDRAGD